MATAQPGPCRCWTTMGWMSEDGGERGRGTARHGAKVAVTWGWHRVHVACPGQGTEHRQGDTGGGREPAPPPPLFLVPRHFSGAGSFSEPHGTEQLRLGSGMQASERGCSRPPISRPQVSCGRERRGADSG